MGQKAPILIWDQNPCLEGELSAALHARRSALIFLEDDT